MKKYFNLVIFSIMVGCAALSGCSDDNSASGGDSSAGDAGGVTLVLEGTSDSDMPVLLLSDESYTLNFHAENAGRVEVTSVPDGWEATVDLSAGRITVKAPEAATEAEKVFRLVVTASGVDGQSVTAEGGDFYHLTFDDPEGAFVLNEGNMTSDNGSLLYITPEGYMVDGAYHRVNGSDLGNVTQDLCVHDGKMYFISQNGGENAVGATLENDGMLVVADVRTLRKEKGYSNQALASLDWPTHIAVLDEQHVYVRDNAGVWRLDLGEDVPSVTSVTLGSYEAPKAPFAVVGGKVYTYYNGSYMTGLYEISPESDRARQIGDGPFWTYTSIHGIAPAEEGKLWIMGRYSNTYFISKYDVAEGTEERKEIGLLPKPTWDQSGREFVAYGNLLYYVDGTVLYRFDFEQEKEEILVDLSFLDADARESYNGLGVNPTNGYVYVNTLKGVGGLYTTNQIWVFQPSDFETQRFKFDDYTRFPAGVFFVN